VLAVRIGVIGPVGADYFASHVGDSLQLMGHQVTQLGPGREIYRSRVANGVAATAKDAQPGLDEWAQRQVVRRAGEAACEVIINLDLNLMPGIVRQLRHGGARVAFWYPDHVANMGRQLMLLAPYDAFFFKEPHVVERLRANLGLPAYYLPEACNPRWHRPTVAAGTDPYLVLAGSMYPSRTRLLERLIAKGIPLKLYGGPFPRWFGETTAREVHTGRAVFTDEKAAVFRGAAGVLNTLHPAEISGVNARLFEATGCGAAVLTEYRPVLPELFEVGQEVLVFADFDELVDQSTRVLNEAGLTAAIGDAAAARAHRDHSYEVRLTTLLRLVS
jgi:spore maturation protein CgeB